jgi:hypothetical protein
MAGGEIMSNFSYQDIESPRGILDKFPHGDFETLLSGRNYLR